MYDNDKNFMLRIRINSEQKEQLDKIVKAKGATISGVVRILIERYIKDNS